MNNVIDLRSAIDLLKSLPGEYVETDVEVDPKAELSGVYRHVGAGGTVMRPTKIGPAMMFNSIKGHPDARVIIGVLASRKRVAALLDVEPERLGFYMRDAVKTPIPPVAYTGEKPPCQEVVHYATDEGFDLRKLVPAPTNTPEDAGPYVTMGLCAGTDPENGDTDVTIHRLCLQSADEMSMWITPGARHLGAFYDKYEKLNKPMPISVSIGLDPAIYLASGFEPPTTPIGYNELGCAGAIRQKPVELCKCLTIDETAVANAEYVIEGLLMPHDRVPEDRSTGTGKAMPEFPGQTGPAPMVPIIKVTAVTHRVNPIMQTTIGPSEEHVHMAGLPTEASIINMVETAMPGRLLNVYAHPSGGGKYMAIMQFKKSIPSDEGRQRQAALLAFSAFSELKHVILVDEDVDPFDSNDVLWALNTRYQGDIDTVMIPGVRCHPLDHTQETSYNPMISDLGISCKTIFDCTMPFKLKEHFERSKFLDVDPKKWLPDMF
ncbi:MAG: UbiD family decarboxylase [Lachnospiraceae bacterium]|nr:UbiD family decarboxylase [Lachnospiraceae bacterium]